MATVEQEAAALDTMLADFKDYILSGEIFWQLGSHSIHTVRYSQLTLGGVMMLHARLWALAPGDMAVQRLHGQYEALFAQWHSNIQRKALAEIRARLNSWRWFLDDCPDNPRKCIDYYHAEVYPRVYITLLLDILEGVAEAAPFRRQTAILDTVLRRRWKPGEFVWEAELQPIFDSMRFWFLYGRPSK